MKQLILKSVAALTLSLLAACGPGAKVSDTAHVFGGATKGGVDQVTACTRGGIEGKSCGMYVRNDKGEIHMVDKVTGDTVGGRAAMAATPALIGAAGNYLTATAVAKEHRKGCKNCGSGGASAAVYLGSGAVTASAGASADSASTSDAVLQDGVKLGTMD